MFTCWQLRPANPNAHPLRHSPENRSHGPPAIQLHVWAQFAPNVPVTQAAKIYLPKKPSHDIFQLRSSFSLEQRTCTTVCLIYCSCIFSNSLLAVSVCFGTYYLLKSTHLGHWCYFISMFLQIQWTLGWFLCCCNFHCLIYFNIIIKYNQHLFHTSLVFKKQIPTPFIERFTWTTKV